MKGGDGEFDEVCDDAFLMLSSTVCTEPYAEQADAAMRRHAREGFRRCAELEDRGCGRRGGVEADHVCLVSIKLNVVVVVELVGSGDDGGRFLVGAGNEGGVVDESSDGRGNGGGGGGARHGIARKFLLDSTEKWIVKNTPEQGAFCASLVQASFRVVRIGEAEVSDHAIHSVMGNISVEIDELGGEFEASEGEDEGLGVNRVERAPHVLVDGPEFLLMFAGVLHDVIYKVDNLIRACARKHGGIEAAEDVVATENGREAS